MGALDIFNHFPKLEVVRFRFQTLLFIKVLRKDQPAMSKIIQDVSEKYAIPKLVQSCGARYKRITRELSIITETAYAKCW